MQLLHPVPSHNRTIYVSQRFGERPEVYKKWGLQGHNGVDFAVPVGTPVRSAGPTEGEVTKCNMSDPDKSPLGYYVIVDHLPCEKYPGGYRTVYAHLRLLNVARGNLISPGQTVGTSGNSGNSTGPHLHFGFAPLPKDRSNGFGGYIDPYPLISWDTDDVPTYINRYNPYRAQQGLEELTPDARADGQKSLTGTLTAEQEKTDRALVGLPPTLMQKLDNILDVSQDDTEAKAVTKMLVRDNIKEVRRGVTALPARSLVLTLAVLAVNVFFGIDLSNIVPLLSGNTAAVAPMVAPISVPVATPIAVVPTPRPVPTLTATPPRDCTYKTAVNAFNIRKGPGTDYERVGRIAIGQTYCVFGIDSTTANWLEIDSGWVMIEQDGYMSFDVPLQKELG